jgi:hypothetical protein
MSPLRPSSRTNPGKRWRSTSSAVGSNSDIARPPGAGKIVAKNNESFEGLFNLQREAKCSRRVFVPWG